MGAPLQRPLRVLLLEDDPVDAELMVRELTRAGFTVDPRRVENEAEFAAALGPEIDLVLADYQLPQYDGLRALALRNQRKLDIPFIIVSGAIGEELAVAAMLQGAFAYVMKQRMKSLGPIIAKALEEAEVRRESRRAHEELAAEVELRKTIEDSMLAGLVFCDREQRIRHVNAAFSQLVGLSREALVGSAPPFPFEVPEDGGTAPRSSWSKLEDGSVETRLRRPGGETSEVLILTSPLVGRDGLRLGWLRLVYDVTERKRLQAQILQAQKMESIGVLAGGVAHDFNNILTSIIGSSEFVLASLEAGDERRADVEDIKSAAKRAAALTRQLLIFSRKEVARPVVLDLDALVTNLQKMLRRILGEDVSIELELASEGALVRVDPGQMEQVVMNLAVNARDAMPRGGHLTLRTELLGRGRAPAAGCAPSPTGRYVRLSAIDTGCGIAPDIIPRLFEPFFTTKAAGKGSGLGLSIVYGIVREAGGTISVESEVGRGSRFLIDLPEAADETAARPVAAPAATTAGHERVLIVEDDDGVRRVAQRTLELLGYEVVSASSGEQALAIISEPGRPRFDLLLTDVVMPGLGGIELAKEVSRRWPAMKVGLMSGYFDHQALEDIEALRFELVHKPIAPSELGRRVRELLDRRP